jgi:hypothetical protein
MSVSLTFIIPVRHPENAHDWGLLKKMLFQTVLSVGAQESSSWEGLIVANRGSDLPDLPSDVREKWKIVWVDLPPNPLFLRGAQELEAFREAIRWDKGSRILSALRVASGKFVMVVDDDDFVSRKLVSYVERNHQSNGWFIGNGFLWGHGGNFLACQSSFSSLCGTSHIIRRDLLEVPSDIDSADPAYVKEIHGSHQFVRKWLDRRGCPLEMLPFRGAVYRIGHPNAWSRSRSFFRTFLFNRYVLSKPYELVVRLFRIRLLTRKIRSEFWGV